MFDSVSHLKYLEAGDIQDAQEGGGLPLSLVQGLVDSCENPVKQTLVHGLSQSLHCKVSLRRERTIRMEEVRKKGLFQCVITWNNYLLLGLSLLHHLPAHFDSGGEDGAGEVSHIDALQVAHFLGSCVDRLNHRIKDQVGFRG